MKEAHNLSQQSMAAIRDIIQGHATECVIKLTEIEYVGKEWLTQNEWNTEVKPLLERDDG